MNEDFRREANEALELMGEPPLGPHDVVAGGPPAAAAAGAIQFVEPDGHKRSDIVLANGRRLILDMARDQVVAEVNAFIAERPTPLADALPFCGRWRRRMFLELDTIDVVGEDTKTGIVVRNRMHFRRRAVESVQSIGHFWTKYVPGRLMGEGSGNGTDSKILEMRRNAAAAKRMRKGR